MAVASVTFGAPLATHSNIGAAETSGERRSGCERVILYILHCITCLWLGQTHRITKPLSAQHGINVFTIFIIYFHVNYI